MLAPILRLVLTYVVLIAAVLAVFNREKLAGLFAGGDDPAPAVVAAPQAAAAPAPILTPPAASAPAAPEDTMPVYGSDLQTPVAAPQPSAVAPTPAPTPAPAPETPQAATTQTAIAAAVNAARGAYWAGDAEGAKAQMLALARAHPDNADLLGELGNLYFYLRDYPAAADAWYRAGLLLIEQGQWPAQRGFLPSLGMIDPEKAADLAARGQGR